MTSVQEKKPQIDDYRLILATCKRCGAQWSPRNKTKPKCCPHCQCSKWDNYKTPKKKDKRFKSEKKKTQ